MTTTTKISRYVRLVGPAAALILASGSPGVLAEPQAAAAPQAGSAKAAGRAFTIEDLYKVEAPAGIDLSPDGKTLAYALQSKSLPKGKAYEDLYVVATTGGEPRRLTFTEDAKETSPAWSPDGATLAFVADRGGEDGLWLLPAAGGEARKLVTVATGISGPVWSPDGRLIAFASEVWPQCGADDACNKKLDGWRAKGPLTAHVADELLYRHWTSWSDGKVTHVLAVEVATGTLRDLTPGDREAPVFSLSGGGYAFSPDGKELAYTRNPDPKEALAWSTNSDVWVVPVDKGADGRQLPARNLTAANKAWDGDPVYSPDGKFIAYRRQLQPGYESDRFTLCVLDRATGATRVLTEAFDNWVTSAKWMKDSRALVFEADVEGQTPLFRVPADGSSAPVELVRFAQIDEYALAEDAPAAYVVRRAVGAPVELWRVELAAKMPPRRLTRHNADLEAEVDIRPAESVWVPSANGRKVHAYVVKPHGFDPAKKYPVILNIHGGPQMQWTDAFRGDWQIYPGQGYVVVFPNPTGSTGYGQAFTAAISGDYTGAVMEDIHKVADWVEQQPWADGNRVGAMGWSWGGFAMDWLLGTTTRFKAIASMMGMYDARTFYGATEELWYPEWDFKGTPWTSTLYETMNPAKKEKNFKTPTLVLTGELDYRVAYTQSLQLFTALRRQGVPARLVVFPKAGHWPSWYEMALYYTAHLEWFQKHLGGGGAPWTSDDFAYNRVFDPETGERRK